MIIHFTDVLENIVYSCHAFFTASFRIKQVALISMFAWVFRFGLHSFGDPGSGPWMLIPFPWWLFMVWPLISSTFPAQPRVEQEAKSSIRASALGFLFFMMYQSDWEPIMRICQRCGSWRGLSHMPWRQTGESRMPNIWLILPLMCW